MYALQIFVVQASNTGAERAFSLETLIVTKNRTRLNPILVNYICLIASQEKYNTTIKREQKRMKKNRNEMENPSKKKKKQLHVNIDKNDKNDQQNDQKNEEMSNESMVIYLRECMHTLEYSSKDEEVFNLLKERMIDWERDEDDIYVSVPEVTVYRPDHEVWDAFLDVEVEDLNEENVEIVGNVNDNDNDIEMLTS